MSRAVEGKNCGCQRRSNPCSGEWTWQKNKGLLDELKVVQEAIDSERKQLGDQSAEYAKQLKEEALLAPPGPGHHRTCFEGNGSSWHHLQLRISMTLQKSLPRIGPRRTAQLQS